MKLKIIAGVGFLVFIMVITGMLTSCQSDEQIEFQRYYSSGSLVYQTHCQNCHGAHGEGLQALIPPLTDSAYLRANQKNLPCLIKYGTKGKIVIQNKTFEGTMAPNDLSPIEIANVLTYVTNSFGNKFGTINNQEVTGNLEKCF